MTRTLWFLVVLAMALAAILVVLAIGRAQTVSVGALATRAPKVTALMKQRAAEARAEGRPYSIDQRWVPYERISPLLRRAVLIAEDDAFFAHGGLDWNEIEESARENWKKRRIVRGGSTITQQLARNLFLGDERTPVRKLAEIFIALRLERELSKRRIFELYLNLIEWGDGIFGAEAAARRYFGVPASRLNARQAVLLAAVIINPRRYSPLAPNRRIEKRVRMIAGRMHRRGFLDAAQVAFVIGAPPPAADTTQRAFTDWFFGPKPDTAPPAEVPSPPETASTRAPEPVDTAGALHE